MAAIITDQLRILNAKNFVDSVQDSSNSYYAWIGLPDAPEFQSDWNSTPPAPKDSLDDSNYYWDTMIALKKINSGDVSQVIRKISWQSGTTYDMWRNDIDRDNPSQPSGSFDIYDSNFYVMNSEYKVYICLYNNANPENSFRGGPSLDEPNFTDLEPREAGSSGDGYIWKYLYTIKPNQIIKFDSTNYIAIPTDWDTNSSYQSVRENAASGGQLKIVTIRNRGVNIGPANTTYTRVPILGDGRGGEATVVINNDSKIESVTVSKGGSGYTFGTLDLKGGGIPTGTVAPVFDVIIPPNGGHGADIYRELGAYNVLSYARFENDTQNPDFITGNQFAQVGIVKNPKNFGSTTNLTLDKASAVYALKLVGTGYSEAIFTADSFVTQTVGLGSTAIGRVVSYDQQTGILKYWQDRRTAGFNTDGTKNVNPTYGFEQLRFTASPTSGGSVSITPTSGNTLNIHQNFSGISTTINSRTYYLGQEFFNGVSNPESEKYSGDIIYIDNRPSVTRSTSQKEDVKVILQF
jgi:hypothetical protein|tara:strand:- start:8063 stop:9622 length:1560 start_codon:yes stop_codon:yes gene_type:complete